LNSPPAEFTATLRDEGDDRMAELRHPAPQRRKVVGPDHDTRSDGTASVPGLLRRLSGEGSELVRQEVAPAKAEMSDKIQIVKRSAAAMAKDDDGDEQPSRT
jgi:hypothetical protein